MALDDKKLARLRGLIALAGSPMLEEARSAAYKACQIMREEKVDATEVIALLNPAQHQHARPAPPPPPAAPPPEWSPPRLSSAEVEREIDRAVERTIILHGAEVRALRIRLWEAEQELRDRDREDAARRVEERKQQELASLRRRPPAPIQKPRPRHAKSWW